VPIPNVDAGTLREATVVAFHQWLIDQTVIQAEAPLWTPYPGPQTMALESQADELFYGGQAGGGKTDLLLGLATSYHRKSVIFRREATRLLSVIERSREIIGTRGRYNGQDNFWRLTGGRTIEFGAAQHEDYRAKWAGRDHDLKAFDEVPQFTATQYRFLIGWTRSVTVGQRIRIVATGNPPSDTEGEWVIERWAPWLDPQYSYPAAPGELRWFTVIDGKDTEFGAGDPFEWKGETLYPKSRTFIPASLADNPALSATPEYRATLQAMPEPTRSQLLYGDFTIGTREEAFQVIPTAWVRAAQARWRPDGRPKDAKGDPVPLTVVGVDPAEGGNDRFVLARRYQNWWGPLEAHSLGSLPDYDDTGLAPSEDTKAGRILIDRGGPPVMRALTEGGQATIDADGIGASLVAWVRWRSGGKASGFRGNAATRIRDHYDQVGFANLRSAVYWKLRDWLDPAIGFDCALPPGRELLAELCAPRFSVQTTGIALEPKAKIKERLGRSPDLADAVVMSLVQMPKGGTVDFTMELG